MAQRFRHLLVGGRRHECTNGDGMGDCKASPSLSKSLGLPLPNGELSPETSRSAARGSGVGTRVRDPRRERAQCATNAENAKPRTPAENAKPRRQHKCQKLFQNNYQLKGTPLSQATGNRGGVPGRVAQSSKSTLRAYNRGGDSGNESLIEGVEPMVKKGGLYIRRRHPARQGNPTNDRSYPETGGRSTLLIGFPGAF